MNLQISGTRHWTNPALTSHTGHYVCLFKAAFTEFTALEEYARGFAGRVV